MSLSEEKLLWVAVSVSLSSGMSYLFLTKTRAETPAARKQQHGNHKRYFRVEGGGAWGKSYTTHTPDQ